MPAANKLCSPSVLAAERDRVRHNVVDCALERRNAAKWRKLAAQLKTHGKRPKIRGEKAKRMATIIISGPALVCDEKTNEEITDSQKLKDFDGAEERGANLAEYLEDGDLAHLGIARGDLKLKYDSKTRRIQVVSTFEAPQLLSPKQLKSLVAFARDQWSDGAGEGAFYKLLDKHGVSIDLTPSGSERKTRVRQTKPGGQKLKTTPALVVAAEKGNIAKVERLLQGGADINSRGKDRQTALQEAILNDHFQLAALLIDRGADVNVADKWGNTPLCTAATSGNLTIVKRVIAAGADVNRADKEGRTPLMWAANRHSGPIVKLLLEHGANPNAKDRVPCNEGGTAITYVGRHKPEIIALLVSHGAKIKEKGKGASIERILVLARVSAKFGDNREAAEYRKLAALLKKHVK